MGFVKGLFIGGLLGIFTFSNINLLSQTPSGSQVANRFIDFMNSSPVISSSFIFKADDASGKEVANLKCSLLLQGNSYKMVNDNIEIYCDGLSKWIVNTDASEVTIMNNDASSVDASENPLAFFASLNSMYSFPNTASKKVVNGVNGLSVKLTARKGNNSVYPTIVLTTDNSGQPLAIEFKAKNGFVYSIGNFRFIRKSELLGKEEFKPSASKVKGLYINDLR